MINHAKEKPVDSVISFIINDFHFGRSKMSGVITCLSKTQSLIHAPGIVKTLSDWLLIYLNETKPHARPMKIIFSYHLQLY